MGSRHSAQTLRLREFLSRNGHPYTYVDLDTDQTSQELLDRFQVGPSEDPGRDLPRPHRHAQPSVQDLVGLPRLEQSASMGRRCAT